MTTFLNQTNIFNDFTNINSTQILDSDVVLSNCQEIFNDFLRCQNSSQNDLFTAVDNYKQLCEDNVNLLLKLSASSLPSESKLSNCEQMLNFLKTEMSTWTLLSLLYKDRFNSQEEICDKYPALLTLQHNEKELTDALFKEDSSLRRAQLIIDWLENEFRMNSRELREIEFSLEHIGTWENTLHILKQSNKGNLISTKNLVNEMDPDAPLRQNKRLDENDEEDNEKLINYVFYCIKSGQMEQAMKMCRSVGQHWRAAVLEGWKLYCDLNLKELGSGGMLHAITGNPNRQLWKHTCWLMAQNEKMSKKEKAIYSALSGNLKAILPICKTWQDYLWAYMKSLVDVKVEKNIRIKFEGLKKFSALPEIYYDSDKSFESIFSEIELSTKENVKIECGNRFNIIQKFIILDDTQSLLNIMETWCLDKNVTLQPHLIRFMAHLVLFLRSYKLTTKSINQLSSADVVLKSYVEYLIDSKHKELISSYVSYLPKNLQIQLYSKFLEDIEGTDKRQHCLELAYEAGLDIELITKQVVINICRVDASFNFNILNEAPVFDLHSEVTQEDIKKIESIEWLLFNPSHRIEAVVQANYNFRIFLCLRKLEACKLLLKKIPKNSVELILKLKKTIKEVDDHYFEVDNVIREFLCIKSYLKAQESFSDWFDHLHNKRPIKPVSKLLSTFSEKVGMEGNMKKYDQDMNKWQQLLTIKSKAAEECLKEVLLFPDGGWMVDQDIFDRYDKLREQQMNLLRKMYLPSTCHLLHRLYHETNQFQSCHHLVTIITSENHQLYKVFSQEQMKKIISDILESSFALISQGLDSLGYPIS